MGCKTHQDSFAKTTCIVWLIGPLWWLAGRITVTMWCCWLRDSSGPASKHTRETELVPCSKANHPKPAPLVRSSLAGLPEWSCQTAAEALAADRQVQRGKLGGSPAAPPDSLPGSHMANWQIRHLFLYGIAGKWVVIFKYAYRTQKIMYRLISKFVCVWEHHRPNTTPKPQEKCCFYIICTV